MSQFLDLIKSVGTGDNLALLSSLAGPVQDQIKEKLVGSVNGGATGSMDSFANNMVAENIGNVIEEKAPVLSNSIKSVSKIYRWRGIIIIGLLVWTIFMILSRILIKNEETKEHIEKANTLLIGNTGILMTIAYIWFYSLIVIAIVPSIVTVVPKLETLLGTVNSAVGVFTGSK